MDRDKLIIDNMKLVYYVMNKYFYEHIEINTSNKDELESAGMVALVKVADNYNQNKDIKFSTYAFKCIWGNMMSVINKNKENKNNIELFSLEYNFNEYEDDVSNLHKFLHKEDENFKLIEWKMALNKA
ncbi:MAG: sigma factor, partial [Peptostreptococcaceae bacterium]